MPTLTYRDALNQALREEMRRDSRIFLMGEEVGVYRTKEEVEEQRKRDPITQLAHKLKEEGALDDAALDALDAEARAETDAAARFAEESPDPEPAELTTHVLAD